MQFVGAVTMQDRRYCGKVKMISLPGVTASRTHFKQDLCTIGGIVRVRRPGSGLVEPRSVCVPGASHIATLDRVVLAKKSLLLSCTVETCFI